MKKGTFLLIVILFAAAIALAYIFRKPLRGEARSRPYLTSFDADSQTGKDPRLIYSGPDGRVGVVTKFFHDTLTAAVYDQIKAITILGLKEISGDTTDDLVAYRNGKYALIGSNGISECVYDEIDRQDHMAVSKIEDKRGDLVLYRIVRIGNLYGAIDNDTGQVFVPVQYKSKDDVEARF